MAGKKAATKAAKAGTSKEALEAKRPPGRPSSFSQAVADTICDRLAHKESLRSICKDEAMPGMTTVFKWLADFPEFTKQYVRAREVQAELLAEEIVEIADEECTMLRHGDDEGETEVVFDATAVARNRLRVDARKWYASKLAPKKYGEKVQVGGAEDLPPVSTVHAMSEEALLAIASKAAQQK